MNLYTLYSLRPLRPKFPYLSPFSLSNKFSLALSPSPMGANLCTIRRPATADASGDGLGFAGYEICGWRRRQWWRRERNEVKRELEASIEKKETKEFMSLEELLLASPGAPSERGEGNDGEFNVSRHGGFKRKVHPARILERSSVCDERSGFVGESVAKDEYSSHSGFPICRRESGKLKKKVSFRLPEVSDVIVIPSLEDDVTADDRNVVS
ncbi:uncharacterized protein LOC103498217 isoform X2 [Cucumis melo]|uniref:Uncharacterized protein LOC103498217 isoform X2 n=1 Tax=Cucumis melo TaxID=3656 RepID=A0A1S3C9M5_CUCME|nr:uncharacterized protein LOC103498217 isoform X2 [Cucumis melo]